MTKTYFSPTILKKTMTFLSSAFPKEYRSWANMVQRCCNKNNINWDCYGGRGIKICQRWRYSFRNFIEDVGPRPSKLHNSLDRIDNDGNYEPGNCRWATRKEQSKNTRRTRILTHHGKSMCIADWARELGLNFLTLYQRLEKGWPLERALLPKNDSRCIRKEYDRKDAIMITYKGETKQLYRWTQQLNVDYHLTRDRVKRGWSFERAISTPRLVQPRKYKKGKAAYQESL